MNLYFQMYSMFSKKKKKKNSFQGPFHKGILNMFKVLSKLGHVRTEKIMYFNNTDIFLLKHSV